MVYRTPYPWHIELPTYGVLKPLPMVRYIEPPIQGILTRYPWYIEAATHGISNPLPMVF